MPPERYRTRFAPSPTGLLHLGHAYSALTAWDRANARGGEFLLRIEDIDTARCRPEFEAAIFEDLHWMGLRWPEPVIRQSGRLMHYAAALDVLADRGLVYPCRCTRGEIRGALSAPQEGVAAEGPYPGTCRGRRMAEARSADAIRLNMEAVLEVTQPLPGFVETGPLHHGEQSLDPAKLLREHGDVVLARRDIGTSYHLAVVVDDAAQEITEVVRGDDLFSATALHVLLQRLLELPTPNYYHHALIRDQHGKRLAKRDDARAVRLFREAGESPQDLRRRVGLAAE